MHLRSFVPFRAAAALILPALFLTAACGRSDADIRTSVETNIATDAATSSSHVVVDVQQGVVRLSGDAMTRAAIQRVAEIATAVKGVKQVTNEVKLSDAAIAANVKQAVTADPVVGKVPLEVTSQDGLVQLRSDQTNKDERTRIVEITSRIDGVTKVEDWMR